MKPKILITTLLILLSVTSYAKYKPSPYVAMGGYAKIKDVGICGETGVVFPIYKFISAGAFCEVYTQNCVAFDAYYGIRGSFKLFNKELHSGKLYTQGGLNVLYDKTLYYSFGYSHSIFINKHLSTQLVPYYSTNTSKDFVDGSFGMVVFFTYSF